MKTMASKGASRNKVSHSKPGPLVSAERTRCPRRVSVSPNWTSLLGLAAMPERRYHSLRATQWHPNSPPENAKVLFRLLSGPDDSHEFTTSIEDLVESLMTNEKPHRNAVCKQFL